MIKPFSKIHFSASFSKLLTLVRHGQSIANAGLPINCSYSQYPITKLGQIQAIDFANSIKNPPDVIYASTFLRTQQTSIPLQQKFPNVPFKIDVRLRAFTYLDKPYYGPLRYSRKEHIKQYWDREDPYFYDGKETESFHDFYIRAISFLNSIKKSKENNIIAFTHSMFVRFTETYIANPNDPLPIFMKKYSNYRLHRKVLNGESVKFYLD